MARNDLDKVLEHINRDRRGFFKTLLIGTAIAAPLMTTQALRKKRATTRALAASATMVWSSARRRENARYRKRRRACTARQSVAA